MIGRRSFLKKGLLISSGATIDASVPVLCASRVPVLGRDAAWNG